MSRFADTTDATNPEDHLNNDPGAGTRRYRKARDEALQANQAQNAHDRLSAQIDANVVRKQVTLAQVRQAVGLTQTQLAEELGIAQGDVSKIEHRDNLRLTTLARFIEATGGHLRIVAVYDDTEVTLAVGDITTNA